MKTGSRVQGITAVNGSVVLDGQLQGGGVLVVHGNVTIARNGVSAPGGLLIWTDGEVRVPEGSTYVEAFIMSEKSIKVTGNNVRINGGLLAKDVAITGNNVQVTWTDRGLRAFPR